MWTDLEQFWKESIFGSPLEGVIDKDKNFFPPGMELPPGEYYPVYYSVYVDCDSLDDLLEESIERFQEVLKTNPEQAVAVEKTLLLDFTHSSLHQEGNTLTRF